MRVNGQSFSVSTTRYEDLRRLRACAGNCTLLPVFNPVHFPHSTHIWRLLYVFFCHNLCCFLAGCFVLYMAGIFNSYSSTSLFIALTDSPCCGASYDRNQTRWTVSTSTDISLNFRTSTMKKISTSTKSRVAVLRLPLLFTG